MLGRWKLKYNQYRERRRYEYWLSNGRDVYLRNLLEAAGETALPEFDRLRFRDGTDWIVNDPGSAAYIFQELFITRDYDYPEIKTAKTIVDIGANIGLFTYFAGLQSPTAEMHCFEPDLRNYRVLEQNLNAIPATTIVNHSAVASEAGELQFYSSDYGGWSSAFGTLGAEESESYRVPAIVLSDYLREHSISCIDFLKIDVEGSEYDILMGDDLLWETEIKCLVVEVDRTPRDERYSEADMRSFLEEKFHSLECASPDAPYPVYYCRQSKVAVSY